MPSRGLVFVDDFCRHAGLDRATVERLLREGKVEGGYGEAGRPIGLFDDALPGREQLLAWGLTPRHEYSPDELRADGPSAEGATAVRHRDARPSWTMQFGRATPVVTVLSGVEAVPWAAKVWPCYDTAFGDFADYETWRSDLFERHAGRDGYRLAVACENDSIIGFAWGYVGQRGQYWSDLAWDALPGDVASQWIGGHFEFVELAVLPTHRGRGLGQELHDRLLDDVRRRCLLSTSDDQDDPAVRLYLRSGWQRVGTLRPGVQVMGLDRRTPPQADDADPPVR